MSSSSKHQRPKIVRTNFVETNQKYVRSETDPTTSLPAQVAKLWTVMIEPTNSLSSHQSQQQQQSNEEQAALWKHLRYDRESELAMKDKRTLDRIKDTTASARNKIKTHVTRMSAASSSAAAENNNNNSKNEDAAAHHQSPEKGNEMQNETNNSNSNAIKNDNKPSSPTNTAAATMTARNLEWIDETFPDISAGFVSFSKQLFVHPNRLVVSARDSQSINSNNSIISDLSSSSNQLTPEEKTRQLHLQTTKVILQASSSKNSGLKSYVALLRTVFPWAVQQDIFLNSEDEEQNVAIVNRLQKEFGNSFCLPSYITQFIAGIFFVGFEAAVQQTQASHLNRIDFVNKAEFMNASLSPNSSGSSSSNTNVTLTQTQLIQRKREEAARRSDVIDNLPVLKGEDLERIFMSSLVSSSSENNSNNTQTQTQTTSNSTAIDRARKILKTLISIWESIRERTINPPRFPHGTPLVWIGSRRIEGTTRAYIDPNCLVSEEKRKRTIGLCQLLIKHLDSYVLKNPILSFPVSALMNLRLPSSSYGSNSSNSNHNGSSPVFPTIHLFQDTANTSAKHFYDAYMLMHSTSNKKKNLSSSSTADSMMMMNSNNNTIPTSSSSSQNNSNNRRGVETLEDVGALLSHFYTSAKLGLIEGSLTNNHHNGSKDDQQIRIYLPAVLGDKILKCVLRTNSSSDDGSNNNTNQQGSKWFILPMMIRERGIASFFIEISQRGLLNKLDRDEINPKTCIMFKNGSVSDLISYRECMFPTETLLDLSLNRRKRAKERNSNSNNNNNSSGAAFQDDDDDDDDDDDFLVPTVVEDEEEKEDRRILNTLMTVAKKTEAFYEKLVADTNQKSGISFDSVAETDEDYVNMNEKLTRQLEKEIKDLQTTLIFVAKHHPLSNNLIGCGIHRVLISASRTTMTCVVGHIIRVCGRRVEFNLLDALKVDSDGNPRLICRHEETRNAILRFSPTLAKFHFTFGSNFYGNSPELLNDYHPSNIECLDKIKDRLVVEARQNFNPVSLVEEDLIQSSLKHVIRCHPNFFSEKVAGCGIMSLGVDHKDNFFIDRVCLKKEIVDLRECYVTEEESKKIREQILKKIRSNNREDDSDADDPPEEDDAKDNTSSKRDGNKSSDNSSNKDNNKQEEIEAIFAPGRKFVLRPPMIPMGMSSNEFLEHSKRGTATKTSRGANRTEVALDFVQDEDDVQKRRRGGGGPSSSSSSSLLPTRRGRSQQ